MFIEFFLLDNDVHERRNVVYLTVFFLISLMFVRKSFSHAIFILRTILCCEYFIVPVSAEYPRLPFWFLIQSHRSRAYYQCPSFDRKCQLIVINNAYTFFLECVDGAPRSFSIDTALHLRDLPLC